MNTEPSPTGDLDDMLDALGNDRRLLGEMIDIFVQNAERLQTDLRTAVVTGDARQTARIAHRLLGSVANFSRGDVRESLARLEQLAMAGDLGQAQAELPRMERALSRLIRVMGGYRR
jgi:HPt (histidine-containing phosphotransfer) domain-containing protein